MAGRQGRAAAPATRKERAAIARAMDTLAAAVEAAQTSLRAASPATTAFIDEHESWPRNFIWTDGSQVATAARRIASLLRSHRRGQP